MKPGDVMFLPSGRVHALGAGSVLFEIQQNSDTTYRGKPRDLHIPQSLASIDFNDFEPALARGGIIPTAVRFGAAVSGCSQDERSWQTPPA